MVKFDQHECRLHYEVEDNILKQVIDTGIFINLRRKWYQFCMISRKHPETKLYFKSAAACRKEEIRNAVNYVYMIHPFSLFNLYWEFLLIFVYPFIFVTYAWNAGFRHHVTVVFLNYASFFGDVVLFVDMLKLFFTGYYDFERSSVVLNPKGVAKKYLLTYFFIDFISSFASYGFLVRLIYYHRTTRAVFRWSRFFGVLRILRLIRWLKAVEMYRQYKNYSSYFFQALKAAFTYFTVLMLFYSVMHLIVNNIDQHILNKVVIEGNLETFFSTILTLLVVSYGSTKISEVSQLLVSSIFLSIGYMINLFLYAQILQIWNKFASARNKNENLFRQFKEYMKYKGLPVSLRERIFAYYNFKFQNEFFSESHINEMVSEILRQEILLYVTKNHVEKVEYFQSMPQHVLMKIVSKLKSQIYLPDDVIVNSGSVGNCMFFIYYGTVAVYTAMGKEVCHLEDGAHFGEIGLIFDEIRVTTVVAVTACELFRLKRTDFLAAMEPFQELKNEIVQMAIDRLIKSRS